MQLGVIAARAGDSLARQERRFALALLAPSLLVLLLTTTVPLVYLAWTGLNRVTPSSPSMTLLWGRRYMLQAYFTLGLGSE